MRKPTCVDLFLYAPVDGTYETRVMESQSTYVPLDRRIELYPASPQELQVLLNAEETGKLLTSGRNVTTRQLGATEVYMRSWNMRRKVTLACLKLVLRYIKVPSYLNTIP